jgi:hypothetical protein
MRLTCLVNGVLLHNAHVRTAREYYDIVMKGHPELRYARRFPAFDSLDTTIKVVNEVEVFGMGIPPKVEYGREKDTIIRDDR